MPIQEHLKERLIDKLAPDRWQRAMARTVFDSAATDITVPLDALARLARDHRRAAPAAPQKSAGQQMAAVRGPAALAAIWKDGFKPGTGEHEVLLAAAAL